MKPHHDEVKKTGFLCEVCNIGTKKFTGIYDTETPRGKIVHAIYKCDHCNEVDALPTSMRIDDP